MVYDEHHDTNYKKAKKKLLEDTSICKENRDLFKDFFEEEEYKLKRQNGLSKIDESSYKTLYHYITYFRTINQWFKNKAWKDLTKEDIKKVYDDLEDGKIKNNQGKPYKDLRSYYNKVFRSRPFELAGKEKEVKEAMQFYTSTNKEEVRFIREEDFRKAVNFAIQPEHKLFLWLAFDIGENSFSLLQLKKFDFRKRINEQNQEEYLVNLRKEIIKRSRTARTEPTNFKETCELLNILLQDKKDNDLIFDFGQRQAEKILDRVTKLAKIKTIPANDKPKLKDLRSSMACDLLTKGWTRDEINARLGHKPSSSEIDKYISFLAIDRKTPQKKVYEHNLAKITAELEETKNREKVLINRFERMKDDSDSKNRLLYVLAKDKLAELKGQKREEFLDMIEKIK